MQFSGQRKRIERVVASTTDAPALSLLPSRVEIDLEALANNISLLKAHLGAGVGIMAVVKANAYGHGALSVAKTVIENGADFLAVANLAEAMDLREGGIVAPILVLGFVPDYVIPLAVQSDISVSVFDVDLARRYQVAARGTYRVLKAQIKIDTGMGRLGILPIDMANLLRKLHELDQIQFEGIYTHFSAAVEDAAHTEGQLETFEQVLRQARLAGRKFKYVHAANSAAILSCPSDGYNMARPGLLLYGLRPSPKFATVDRLRPVMSWKTTVAQVKTLSANSPVGYGNSYRTCGVETIAILPVGYADGLRRSPRTWREVLVRGQRAPLVGRVSMEKTAVNVSHIPNVQAGDEVVLLGKQGSDEISADEIANWMGTINYEVVTSILARAERS